MIDAMDIFSGIIKSIPWWFWLIIVAGVIIAAFNQLTGLRHGYEYRRKEFLMTAFERECFNALAPAFGNQYYIFAQIHLDALLEHKIRGQSWIGARARISQKSVDFVLCDKNSLKTVLAIELDDSTHEIFARQQRDREVEMILTDADIPLLRIPHEKRADQAWIQSQVADLLRQK